MSDDVIQLVKEAYTRFRVDIKNRLDEFRGVRDCGDERIFLELVFCILTPQSKAVNAWATLQEVYLNGCLWSCGWKELAEYLRRVRFRFNKAKYIVEVRERYLEGGLDFNILLDGHPYLVRHKLASEVKGIGYKEASHFLRNIGYTFNIAILDRHILKYMYRFKVLNEIPKVLTPKRYILIEDKFIWLSKYLGLSPAELDLVLWAMETGYVFK